MIDFQDNWNTNLKTLIEKRYKNYEDIRVDLSAARDNFLISQAGDFLKVISASNQAASCSIKFNTTDNSPIDLTVGKTIQTIFKGIYLTNAATAGAWLIIRVGIIYVEDESSAPRRVTARPALTVTNVAANTDTPAAANLCDKVLIKASNQNTDIVWVNFGVAAVQGSCIPLEPGESITVDLDNTSQVHCNFVVANEKAFIIFEV